MKNARSIYLINDSTYDLVWENVIRPVAREIDVQLGFNVSLQCRSVIWTPELSTEVIRRQMYNHLRYSQI